MHQSINIDQATELVKNIVDSNRCAICDKINGERMRYPCGHSGCDKCVAATESCLLCLTPQDSSSFAVPCIDTSFTQRSRNAINLINAFQAEFNIDVYKRQRISEQLKVEKDLFPQCIQAPAKYYNKKKKSKPKEDKENNITIFPGEEVSLLNKMENSNANVREWLNMCVKRKPLGDLKNSRSLNTIHNQPRKILNTHIVNRSQRKRNHSEIWGDENQTFLDNVTPSKKIKEKITANLSKAKNKDDSGISIDDEVIVIDDSQSVNVDKDMNAWLAVLEAEKHVQCGSTTIASQASNLSHKSPITQKRVPFYIKSPLSDNCVYCNVKKSIEKPDDQSNISITVESKSFTAIINVSKAEKSTKSNDKQSVQVQTDLESDHGFDERHENEMNEKGIIRAFSPIPSSSKSRDIFLGEANMSPVNKSMNKSSNLIIAETESSESDDDVEHSTSLQIIADVHRSCDEISVLGEVEDIQEHSKRARRAARGHTPTSTDSSDKENYNPNRKKRPFNSKKKPVKK